MKETIKPNVKKEENIQQVKRQNQPENKIQKQQKYENKNHNSNENQNENRNINKDDNRNNNKNEKKIIIYLITIAIILIYIALFFINYIVDKGKIKDTVSTTIPSPDNTVMGEEDDKDIIIDNSDRFRVTQVSKDNQGNETTTDWNELKELDIFNNKYFEDKSIIAPGVSGSYSFTVENESTSKFLYNIDFTDENKYDINMVFKLKVDGKYVAGNEETWVKSNQLNMVEIPLNTYEIHVYTVEWKWEDAENDTQIGETDGAYYKMFIDVLATQVVE